jgi:hypothetical protein
MIPKRESDVVVVDRHLVPQFAKVYFYVDHNGILRGTNGNKHTSVNKVMCVADSLFLE